MAAFGTKKEAREYEKGNELDKCVCEHILVRGVVKIKKKPA